jgi:protoheme IX farnesyltransferase
MIQFFWQFPHFWALGWMLDDDYKKAGFNMLPTGQRDKKTAIQIILYVIWMIIISVFPYSGLTGSLTLSFYGVIIVLCVGIIMLFFAINLYNRMDINSAKNLFLYTIFYLTSIQLVYIIDKFL